MNVEGMTFPDVGPATSSERIVSDVLRERTRNRARWGVQMYPSITPVAGSGGDAACGMHAIPTESRCKQRVEYYARAGRLTWTDVLLEEFAEAVAAPDDTARRAELVQVAAVTLAWIECLDMRQAIAQEATEDGAGFRPAGDPRAVPARFDPNIPDQEKLLANARSASRSEHTSQIAERDYYVLVKPWAVYVKEGHFFESQGGCTSEWGKAWRKVRATSIDDARGQGYRMPPSEVHS